MSVSALNFALEQDYLAAIEHLALIMIADHCGDDFTSEEAIETIWRHTSIDERAARNVFQSLQDKRLIHPTAYQPDDAKRFMIFEVQ